MPNWWTPLGVINTTKVWFVEINRLACRKSSFYRAEIYVVSRYHLFHMRNNNPDWIFVPQQAGCVECAYETQVPVPKPVIWIGLGQPELRSRSNSSYEDEGGFENEPGVSYLQPDRPTSRGHESRISCSSIASDEEEIFQSGPGQQVQTPSTSQRTRPAGPQRSAVRAFIGGPRGQKGNEAPHI